MFRTQNRFAVLGNVDDNKFCIYDIIRLYHRWCKVFPDEYRKYMMANNYDSISPHGSHLGLNNLDVTNQRLISDFEKYNQLVLQKYNGETSLIIGCGNGPVCSFRWEEKERKFHQHEKCYTMDMDLSMNPSIVGFFGQESFHSIPDASFDDVDMEGCCCVGEFTDLFISELLRITKPEAKLGISTSLTKNIELQCGSRSDLLKGRYYIYTPGKPGEKYINGWIFLDQKNIRDIVANPDKYQFIQEDIVSVSLKYSD